MKKLSLALAAALAVLFMLSTASANTARPRVKLHPAAFKHIPKASHAAPRIQLHPRIKMLRINRSPARPLRYSR